MVLLGCSYQDIHCTKEITRMKRTLPFRWVFLIWHLFILLLPMLLLLLLLLIPINTTINNKSRNRIIPVMDIQKKVVGILSRVLRSGTCRIPCCIVTTSITRRTSQTTSSILSTSSSTSTTTGTSSGIGR